MQQSPRVFTPTRVIALWLAAPAVIGALALVVLDSRDVIRQSAVRDGLLPEGSFADAIRNGGVEDAYAFVRAGVDPNEPIAFSHADLTAGHAIIVAPLVLAVATHNENVVTMLLGFGVRMDRPGNRRAVCLAKRLGYDDLAATIVRDGRPASPIDCSTIASSAGPPLLDFAD